MSWQSGPPGASGADDTAAVRAAARLRRSAAGDGAGQSDLSPRELVAYLIFVDVLFTGFAIWMGITLSVELPYGWLFLLAGLPAWLLVRMIFFSMRGSETGLVTVDTGGIVRVVTGRRSIRRLARMYEHGPSRWMRSGVLGGLALFFGGMATLVILTLLLDSPAPFMLFLTASLWAMLDLVRFTYVLMVTARRDGQQTLDGVELLPMLAAYGRRRGWRETFDGVPADRLLGVLAEHPEDSRQLQEYAAAHRLLMGIAMPLARWGSASGPPG